MIIDNLKNIKKYYGLGERLDKAIKYLEETDFSQVECGKYEIDGSNVYASVQEYDTKSKEEKRWEAHKNYIDIQYIFKGREQMGYDNVDNLKITVPYDSSKDVCFGETKGNFLVADEGTFMLFMPQDTHMPGVTLEEKRHIKKVVMKILA